LELPLHIDFKNDMLAVSNLLLTVRLYRSDTPNVSALAASSQAFQPPI
jgi:hypothetical protein